MYRCAFVCDFRLWIVEHVNKSETAISVPQEEFLGLLDQMQETADELKTALGQFTLFDYPKDPPEKYIQDFYTRVAHDLIRNKGELERCVCFWLHLI